MSSKEPNQYLNISLVTAARRGNMRVLKQMLRKGADVNGNSDYETSFSQAAHCGHAECVDFLLKAGADVNILCFNRTTILMKATEGGSAGCVELLLLAGAGVGVNIRDVYEDTVLMHAAMKCNWECIKILLNAGADVNIKVRDFGIKTVIDALLHDSATPNRIKSLKVLLSAGAKVNQLWLNFHHIIKNERLQIQRLLLVAGETKFHVEQELLVTTPRKEMCLTFWCRDMICKYLKTLDRHENLFVRIRKLGLPTLLRKILLFNCSLDVDDDEED